ncbi:MAG: WbuC family cupin fold metalloprotein [Gammaproteobacteria bacterium]|nr:WbuC family cupin fold metalloprotein [Gammaproteobacteria bacterium]
MRQFSQDDLKRVALEANQNSRRRMNHNIHSELEDPIQRLVNVIQPGSYVQPHRHPGADIWELFCLLQGELLVLCFDDAGIVSQRQHLKREENLIVEIPPRTWHSIIALQENSTVFEIKPGPYRPVTDKDFARWAPGVEDNLSSEFVSWMQIAKVGDCFQATTV